MAEPECSSGAASELGEESHSDSSSESTELSLPSGSSISESVEVVKKFVDSFSSPKVL